MSDFNPSDYPFEDEVDTSAEAEPTAEIGEDFPVEGDEYTDDTPEPTEAESPALSEGDPTEVVFVTEDGTEITREEARRGWLRQADYTRKTQEIAAQRAELAAFETLRAALSQDPQGTLSVLAQQYNVPFGTPSPQAPQSADPYEGYGLDEPEAGPQEFVDPVARQWIEQQQQALARQQIEGELSQIRTIDPALDEVAVLRHAHANGLTIRAAYADLNFDRIAAAKAAPPEPSAEERQAAARAAAAATHRSTSRGGRQTEAAPPADADFATLLRWQAKQAGVKDLAELALAG